MHSQHYVHSTKSFIPYSPECRLEYSIVATLYPGYFFFIPQWNPCRGGILLNPDCEAVLVVFVVAVVVVANVVVVVVGSSGGGLSAIICLLFVCLFTVIVSLNLKCYCCNQQIWTISQRKYTGMKSP